MPDEDGEDDVGFRGFAESSEPLDFAGRVERVRAMSDAELLNAHRVLSNARVVVDELWLPIIEAELELRGLKSVH